MLQFYLSVILTIHQILNLGGSSESRFMNLAQLIPESERYSILFQGNAYLYDQILFKQSSSDFCKYSDVKRDTYQYLLKMQTSKIVIMIHLLSTLLLSKL